MDGKKPKQKLKQHRPLATLFPGSNSLLHSHLSLTNHEQSEEDRNGGLYSYDHKKHIYIYKVYLWSYIYDIMIRYIIKLCYGQIYNKVCSWSLYIKCIYDYIKYNYDDIKTLFIKTKTTTRELIKKFLSGCFLMWSIWF